MCPHPFTCSPHVLACMKFSICSKTRPLASSSSSSFNTARYHPQHHHHHDHHCNESSRTVSIELTRHMSRYAIPSYRTNIFETRTVRHHRVDMIIIASFANAVQFFPTLTRSCLVTIIALCLALQTFPPPFPYAFSLVITTSLMGFCITTFINYSNEIR